MKWTSRVGIASLIFVSIAASMDSSSAAQTATRADTITHGRAVFQTYCSVCHGTSGAGFIGPRVSGIPWTPSSLVAIVRNGLGGYGGMPAFSKDSVSDSDVAAISGYLGSTASATPAPSPEPSVAPSASAASDASPDAARGGKLFAANCAACHGAKGEGGYGPSLHNESRRKDFNAAVSWIENPAPPMPKLYPDPLSKQDVQDVAAFIEKL